MAYRIHPFTSEFVDKVKAFNHRLKEGGSEFQSTETPVARIPEHNGLGIRPEHFVLHDDEADRVRGSYTLLHYPFVIRGNPTDLSYIQIPLSEGSVNPQYALLGTLILRDMVRRVPVTFGLGMGGNQTPVARLFKAMRFQLDEVPFYFHVGNARNFLRNIAQLKTSPARRAAAGFARITGLGPIGIHTVQRARSGGVNKLRTEAPRDFDEAADGVWKENRDRHSFLMLRDQHTLNYLYSPRGGRFHCLYFYDGAQMAGWAVVLNTQMTNHKYFGDMRVGTIVDSLALANFESGVLSGATSYLLDGKADLIVCNQMSTGWRVPFRKAGYLSGPSNFVLAQSPQLLKLCQVPGAPELPIHATRGDGDGPYNL